VSGLEPERIYHMDPETIFAVSVLQRLLSCLILSWLLLCNLVLVVKLRHERGWVPSRIGRMQAAWIGVGRLMDMAARASTSHSSIPRDENVVFEVVCSSSIPLSSAMDNFGSAAKTFLSLFPFLESLVIKLTNQSLGFGSRKTGVCRLLQITDSPQLMHSSAMLSTHFPVVQIMQGDIALPMILPMIAESTKSGKPDDKSKQSKYARYGTDMESFRDASQALPYVYKFFWMIYRLSPVRTMIIISVFLIQGFLPALRLRTGGDFIRQVRHVQLSLLTGSYKKEYSRGP